MNRERAIYTQNKKKLSNVLLYTLNTHYNKLLLAP